MDDRPKREDYPDTPAGLHMWAQAVQRWNHLAGVKSDDLINQWNEQRKNS
jgi:hypothetical protein